MAEKKGKGSCEKEKREKTLTPQEDKRGKLIILGLIKGRKSLVKYIGGRKRGGIRELSKIRGTAKEETQKTFFYWQVPREKQYVRSRHKRGDDVTHRREENARGRGKRYLSLKAATNLVKEGIPNKATGGANELSPGRKRGEVIKEGKGGAK